MIVGDPGPVRLVPLGPVRLVPVRLIPIGPVRQVIARLAPLGPVKEGIMSTSNITVTSEDNGHVRVRVDRDGVAAVSHVEADPAWLIREIAEAAGLTVTIEGA